MKKILSLMPLMAVVSCLYFVSAQDTCAGTAVFASDSCDADLLNSMDQRAWMEAQREVSQNNHIIVKPDSVLEYSCFDKHLGHLIWGANQSVKLLSMDNRWGSPPGDTEDALEPVYDSYKEYQEDNYDHDYLSGAVSDGESPIDSLSSAEYGCDIMNQVWEQAKCKGHKLSVGFDGLDKNLDGFGGSCSGTSSQWNDAYNESTGPNVDWDREAVVTLFDRFDNGSNDCGNSLTPPARIETGVRVENIEGVSDYDETICLIPGCYWNPTSSNCVLP